MQNLQTNLERILHHLQTIFKNSFASAYIVDSDALVLAFLSSEVIGENLDNFCAKASKLFNELENFNQISSNKAHRAHIIKNNQFLYIFSRIQDNLRLILKLKNNDHDFTLNNVENISIEIENIIKNAIFDDDMIDNIFSDIQNESRNRLHVLNSTDILIRKIIFELKSIISPTAYKTRLINEFYTNSINVNSDNENLKLILRLTKLLKNNFSISLK